jgi:hypothetical protein
MMKRNCFLLIIAVLLVISAGCVPTVQTLTPTPTAEIVNTDTIDLAALWQEDINLLRAWQDNLPVTEDPTKAKLPDPKPDLMEIFSILDHLKLKEGWLLDYAYHADGMGAYPIFYARQPDAEPILAEELRDKTGTSADEEIRPGVSADYLAYVTSDGSELGYLQLAQLMTMGGQFYLDWHANYNDQIPIATAEALNAEIVANDFGIPLTNDEKSAAAMIDLKPKVTIESDIVRVRYVTFTKWGGFLEQNIKISLATPQSLTVETPINLVPYNCGIMF